MKNSQSRSMIRKLGVRSIAIVFIALGVWYLWVFFAPFLGIGDKEINPILLIYTFFLASAGVGLFRLKSDGRDITLVLLSIRAITNVFLIISLAFQTSENGSVSATAIAMLVWLFIVILMIVFLVQKETKEVFSSEKISTASQSETYS